MSASPSKIIQQLEISSSFVKEETQTFISDMVYRIFYSNDCELRGVEASGTLTESIYVDTISSVFDSTKDDILASYPNIDTAEIRITDHYLTNSDILYVYCDIELTGSDIGLHERATVTFSSGI